MRGFGRVGNLQSSHHRGGGRLSWNQTTTGPSPSAFHTRFFPKPPHDAYMISTNFRGMEQPLFRRRTKEGSYTPTIRRFSSSKNKEEELIQETTPLSDLSFTDLDLALRASRDGEGDDVESEQQRSGGEDVHLSDIPGATKGGKKLAIVFTCNVCDTRSAKRFTERAYRNGVVLVRCPGCENLHLIADRLGYFGDDKDDGGWDIEKAMKRMGKHVMAVTDDNVLELTMADVMGHETSG